MAARSAASSLARAPSTIARLSNKRSSPRPSNSCAQRSTPAFPRRSTSSKMRRVMSATAGSRRRSGRASASRRSPGVSALQSRAVISASHHLLDRKHQDRRRACSAEIFQRLPEYVFLTHGVYRHDIIATRQRRYSRRLGARKNARYFRQFRFRRVHHHIFGAATGPDAAEALNNTFSDTLKFRTAARRRADKNSLASHHGVDCHKTVGFERGASRNEIADRVRKL